MKKFINMQYAFGGGEVYPGASAMASEKKGPGASYPTDAAAADATSELQAASQAAAETAVAASTDQATEADEQQPETKADGGNGGDAPPAEEAPAGPDQQ